MAKFVDGLLGRDPRQHVQVIAGTAAAGRTVDLYHEDGSITEITPNGGRVILDYLNSLKPAERQRVVNEIHESPDGLEQVA